MLLNNPSLAHIAGPGSQASYEVTGLRLMHRFESFQLIIELESNYLHYRSTVGGKVKPSKNPTEAVIPLKYECFNHVPFEDNEYCLFSLKVRFSFRNHSTKAMYSVHALRLLKNPLNRMQSFTHIMENLKQLKSKGRDAKMSMTKLIWQLFQMKIGIRYFKCFMY